MTTTELVFMETRLKATYLSLAVRFFISEVKETSVIVGKQKQILVWSNDAAHQAIVVKVCCLKLCQGCLPYEHFLKFT